MTIRLHKLIWCFLGCAIGSLIGLILLMTFRIPFLAVVTAGLFPVIACRYSGVNGGRQLAKIGIYSGLGWFLTFSLQPAVAMSSDQRVRRIATQSLLGNEWHLPASAVSTLMALVGVSFVPSEYMTPASKTTDGKQ